MSRYAIENENLQDIFVGWDDPLATFFVHVKQLQDGEYEAKWLLDIGNDPAEMTNIWQVVEALKPYSELPPEIAKSLLRDQANRRQPTAFQRNTFKSLTGQDLP